VAVAAAGDVTEVMAQINNQEMVEEVISQPLLEP
jgi:hypothetical protein